MCSWPPWGGFAGFLLAFILDIGATPCRDVFNGVAACAVPQPSGWGVVLGVAIGIAVPLAALRFDDFRAAGRCRCSLATSSRRLQRWAALHRALAGGSG